MLIEMHAKSVKSVEAFEKRHFALTAPVGLKKFIEDPE